MPRYIRQKNSFSCGPIAVLNILKILGKNVTYKKDYKKIVKLCKTNKDGTYDKYLENALAHYNIKFGVVRKATVRSIDKIFSKHGPVIFGYYHGKEGHYTIIINKTKYYYDLVNNLENKTISRISKKTIQQYTRSIYFNKIGFPKIWYFLHDEKN